ncbi:MAG: UbiX family flavin prenyltransferase [Magnetococcales bacterium]|nr:UbiX family flavin prenyltransferase [Magnetococcales bacterium]
MTSFGQEGSGLDSCHIIGQAESAWPNPTARGPVIVAMTGASGAPYGIGLIRALLAARQRVDLLLSEAALQVIAHECQLTWRGDAYALQRTLLDHFSTDVDHLRYHGLTDWTSPVASGSGGARRMVICPCSMGTLGALAHGLADNLIRRAADVVLKEGGLLVLVPRETPLTVIHLENMVRMVRAGAVILPASPGFYHRPATVEALVGFIVERILTRLGMPGSPLFQWPLPVSETRPDPHFSIVKEESK